MPNNNDNNNDSLKPLPNKDPWPARYSVPQLSESSEGKVIPDGLPGWKQGDRSSDLSDMILSDPRGENPTVRLKAPSSRSSNTVCKQPNIKPGFLLQISPNIKTVLPGDAVNFIVFIRGTNGIFERLLLAFIPGLPKIPGEVSLGSQELLVRGGITNRVTLHVQTRTDSAPGTYPIIIEATQKAGNRDFLSFVVQAQVQIVPGLPVIKDE